MEIIQPMDLEAGYRSFSMLGKHRLTTTIKLFFPLQGGIPTLNSAAYELLSDTAGAFCDEALPKLSTEFIVIGDAEAPNEKSVTSLVCKVSLADKTKSMRIIGDRYWTGGLAGISSPLPFKKVPLNWTHSFGGKDFKLNAVGQGINPVDNPLSSDKLIALPNIEQKNKIVTSKGDRPNPINFCSLPQESPLRSKYLGTYDNNWLKTRFPGYPDDFNMKAFYTAADDQRFDHFLNGGETFELENLNHDKPLITGTLPQYRVRMFAIAKGIAVSDIGVNDLYEIDNHIDTVTFYPNQSLGMLSYRGTIDSSTDDASQYKYLLCAYENLDSPPRSKEHYHLSLIGRIHPDLNMQFALTTKDLVADDVPCGIAQLTQQDEEPLQLLAKNLEQKSQLAYEEGKAESQEKLQALLANMKAEGKDTSELQARIEDSLKAPTKDEWALRYEAIMDRIAPGTVQPDGSIDKLKIDLQKIDFKAFDDLNILSKEHADFQLQKVKDDLAAQLKKMTESSTSESPASEAAQQALEKALFKMDLPAELPRPQDPSIMIKQLSDAMVSMKAQQAKALAAGVKVAVPEIDFESLSQNLEESSQQLFEGYRLGAHAMDTGTPPLQDKKDDIMAQFLARIENNESHTGQDYAGLSFVGIDLKGIRLNSCYLEQCDFSGCDLSNCDLSNSIMARSNFSSAKLIKANLENSNIGGCNFKQADLSNAKILNCEYGKSDFSHAKLVNTDLSGSINSLEVIFRHCDMTGIVFSEPSFVDLDFSGANLTGANLTSATFIKCNLARCTFTEAILNGVNFIEANIVSSNFERASMDNCRFMQESLLTECEFAGAIATNCNFRGCDLSQSRFSYANLSFADLSQANAQHCDFSGADLSHSQCMETDFGDANLSNCNLMEANLMKARLTSARINKSNCYGAEFLAATIGKTDFSGSIMDGTKLEHWRPAKWQS